MIILDEDEDDEEEGAHEMCDRWNLVMQYIPHFSTVRTQEREGS